MKQIVKSIAKTIYTINIRFNLKKLHHFIIKKITSYLKTTNLYKVLILISLIISYHLCLFDFFIFSIKKFLS